MFWANILDKENSQGKILRDKKRPKAQYFCNYGQAMGIICKIHYNNTKEYLKALIQGLQNDRASFFVPFL